MRAWCALAFAVSILAAAAVCMDYRAFLIAIPSYKMFRLAMGLELAKMGWKEMKKGKK